jgi:hypothetical protein
MIAAAQADQGASSGGLLGSLAGLAGKALGGEGGAAAALVRLGLSQEQAEKFLPAAADLLKGRLPDDVMKQLGGLLPAPAGSPS